MQESSAQRLPLAAGSSPQPALSEPGMGAQVMLIFRARAPRFMSATESWKGTVFPYKPLMGIDLIRPGFLPDVKALLGGIDPAGDQVFPPGVGSQNSRRG
jgi:hypothetical protein